MNDKDRAEQVLAELNSHVDKVVNSDVPRKENFVEIFMLTVELFVIVFKQINENEKDDEMGK